ncbi:RHS repeat-associated core domain-containing protein [Piscicoccus intestinalis]|uniref:RHS repeat-associated core domain-containing protein n=1 Tax=Piscicoccus intestinalis TaxID=746033 RepID=UPI0008393D6C|nr:RHS repeat-associated core domain-containing protein [Piscicoccus intestinalis]
MNEVCERRVGYVIPDRLGSVIGLIGAGGGSNAVKIVSYAYDPYGNIRSAPGLDEPLAWWNTLTWTGAPRDLQTGLYRLGVRWYDPVTGRFTTPDPTTQETNPYTYAAGNPCNTTDPTGSWGMSLAQGGCLVATSLLSADIGVAVGLGLALAPVTWGSSVVIGAGVSFATSILGGVMCAAIE